MGCQDAEEEEPNARLFMLPSKSLPRIRGGAQETEHAPEIQTVLKRFVEFLPPNADPGRSRAMISPTSWSAQEQAQAGQQYDDPPDDHHRPIPEAYGKGGVTERPPGYPERVTTIPREYGDADLQHSLARAPRRSACSSPLSSLLVSRARGRAPLLVGYQFHAEHREGHGKAGAGFLGEALGRDAKFRFRSRWWNSCAIIRGARIANLCFLHRRGIGNGTCSITAKRSRNGQDSTKRNGISRLPVNVRDSDAPRQFRRAHGPALDGGMSPRNDDAILGSGNGRG